MKIVTRQDFLALPAGAVFCKYSPQNFDDLAIKGESLSDSGDFLYQDIACSIDASSSVDFGNKLEDAEEKGASIPMDFERLSRDGLFDEDQLFAVFERSDVEALIARLQSALVDSSPL